MYCPHCGKEIGDEVNFCPNCGTKLNQTPPSEINEEKDEFFDAPPASAHEQRTIEHEQRASQRNILALVGFGLSFLVPLAGLICSCLGLKKCKELGNEWRGFAIAGIVISAVSMVLNLILQIVYYFYMPEIIEYLNTLIGGAFNGGGNYY